MSTFNFKNTSFNVNQRTLVNPVDLSGDRIKSESNKDIITLIKNNVININDSSNNFIIRNTTTDFVDIDVSNNIINLNAPINIEQIVFNDQLLISDSSGNNFMKFNKMGNIINFYKPTDLSGGGSGPTTYIQYGSGTTDNTTFLLNITFINPYTSAPNIVGTITDGSQSFLSISSITLTGFTVYTWNISGGIQASFNWQAIL